MEFREAVSVFLVLHTARVLLEFLSDEVSSVNLEA